MDGNLYDVYMLKADNLFVQYSEIISKFCLDFRECVGLAWMSPNGYNMHSVDITVKTHS